MPVSPQDYALWSRMTGNPVPTSPAERMAIAPQVYDFSRKLGRRGAEPSGLRKAVDVVGKAALAAGALAGAAYLGQRYGGGVTDSLKSTLQGLRVDDQPKVDEDVFIKEQPAVVEEVQEAAAPSSKEFLNSAITRYSRQEETPDIEVVRVEDVSPSSGTYPEGQQVRSLIPQGLLAPASTDVSTETPDSVRFARETARGMTRAELIGGQYAQTAAKRLGTMEFGGAEPPVAGMADPYALREVAARQTRVEVPATQTVIPQPGAMPGRLQLDDEVAVDNDVIASNPLSTTAAASQDITGADPASAIGQRINVNQTGAAAAARAATEVKPTVASKLAQQQSPVHLEQDGSELVGAPAAGAVEAFRKGRQYQEMTRQNPALRPIPSPTIEGVSSADIYPTVVQRAPVQTVSPSALGEEPPAAPMVAAGARRTADQDEQELLMRKYAGLTPKAQPAAEPEVVTQTVAPASTRTSDFLARFSVPKEVGGPIREVTFGPGSEMEVNMRGTSYPYAAQDPFREAVGAYMSGEEQGEMGSRGGILTGSGLGPKFGLMQKLGPEGVPVQSQTSYRDFPGYMDDKQIQKVMASTGKSTEAKKAQAQRHAESKLLMRALEARAAERTAARGPFTETFSGVAGLG